MKKIFKKIIRFLKKRNGLNENCFKTISSDNVDCGCIKANDIICNLSLKHVD